MKAIVQHGYGLPHDVLELREVEVPHVGELDVLVRVRATSVHADVWAAVTGQPMVLRAMFGLRRPRNPVPGTDVAGVVEAVGRRVTAFAPGDVVFGESNRGMQWVNGGAYAQYASVPESALAQIPAGVSFQQAASVPTSGFIVLSNLPSTALQAGSRLLVNGAAGGVGSIALQVAAARGVHVTAVDDTRTLGLLRSLGADRVVDHTRERLPADEPFDVVLDVASTLTTPQWKRLIASDGTYVRVGHYHYGDRGSRALGTLPGFFGLLARSLFDAQARATTPRPTRQEAMAHLARLLERGHLTPRVDRSYPLAEAPEALCRLREARNVGKILITP